MRSRALRDAVTIPLTSEFMLMASYGPTTFHKLPNDKGESDGSSIGNVAPSHRPSWECAMADAPGQPQVQTHTPPDPRAETPALTREHGEEL